MQKDVKVFTICNLHIIKVSRYVKFMFPGKLPEKIILFSSLPSVVFSKKVFAVYLHKINGSRIKPHRC